MRKVSSAFTLMLVVGMLFGCAGPAPEPAPAQAPAAQTTAEQAEPALRKDMTVTIWQPDTREAWVTALNGVIEGFTAKTGVKVEVLTIPWAELPAKFTAAAASNTLPDIVYALETWGPNWAYAGFIQPVDDVIDAVGREQFSEALLSNVSVDGKVISVPLLTTPHVFWYRQDLYQEKGLKQPASWEELLDNVKALHNPPDTYGYLYYNKPPEPEILQSLMGTNGAADFDESGNVTTNSSETVESLAFLKELASYSPPGSNGKSESEQRLVLAEGGGAHMWSSTSFSDTLQQTPDLKDKFSAFVFPSRQGGRGAVLVISSFSICKDTDVRPEAAAFLTYFMTDGYLKFMQETVIGFTPTTKAVQEDPAYWEHERIKPFESSIRSGVEASKVAVLQAQRFGPNPWAGKAFAAGVWEEMGDRVTLGNEDPSAVAKWGAEKVSELTGQPIK